MEIPHSESHQKHSVLRQQYLSRFLSVIQYIDQHLSNSSKLSVEAISGVAHFSAFHFHRQFFAIFDINVAPYIQILRFYKAGNMLLYRKEASITDIALITGFNSPEGFSRNFKQYFGMAPSTFRSQPNWGVWHKLEHSVTQLRNLQMNTFNTEKNHTSVINVVDFPLTHLAVMEHRDSPETLGRSIQAFIAWRRKNQLSPDKHQTFNLVYDDPNRVTDEHYRFDLACSVPEQYFSKIAVNSDDFLNEASEKDKEPVIVQKSIPAGRCAVLRHIGSDTLLGQSVQALYYDWLPSSGEELRDFPMFFKRVKFFPDVPEQQAITDIFLPLANH